MFQNLLLTYVPTSLNMIELTRLNGETFYLNALLIEQIQSHPDTTITLTNGKKIVVKTDEIDVVQKIKAYHKQVGLFAVEENRT